MWAKGQPPALGAGHQVGSIPTTPIFFMPFQARFDKYDDMDEYPKHKPKVATPKEDGVKMWEIVVPCQYNDGDPVRTRHHKEWDKYVRNISKGLTIYQPAKGQWVDPDTQQLHDERMIPVRIACTELNIRKIGAFTLKHYNQKAVMICLVSEKVIILKSDDQKK